LVLVSMPFADIDRPSIQLGLLKPAAEASGFHVRTWHAGLDLAARIGVPAYRALATHRGRMFGEWLFSAAAFGAAAPDPQARMLDRFGADLPELTRERLLEIRDHEVPAYLDELADDPVWAGVRVAGFTSTFQQNTASLALAGRLRLRYPHVVTVFGGANFDADMGVEYVRAFHCIDYAVAGAGEVALPALLRALADGGDPGTVPGVIRRMHGRVSASPPVPADDDPERSPIPDYGEWFERAAKLGMLDRATVWLPFESSRGCWWGAKHHCTFCGLNGTSMRYRAKSAQRVIDELAGQARRYRIFRFEAVDNILDPRYLTTVLRALADDGAGYELFYELKANLGRAELRLLAQAGVTRIQPGLESLSTRVLGLMRKGVRAAQNVNLLRWARYYGIDVAWNLLWGFPGETEQDYADQAAALPHLMHLQPPDSADRIWLERFSPLYTEQANPKPEASYRYVYPAAVDLGQAAYFFDWPEVGGLADSAYAGVRREVRCWQRLWADGRRPALTYRAAPGLLQIDDRRRHDPEGTYTFPDPVASVYLACVDRPRTAAAVAVETGLPEDAVRQAYTYFARRGLMFLDGSMAVALALPAIPGR
jgi:ribosomal peptide maturation radical SAM protein 1